MVKIKDIYDYIDSIAPFSLQAAYDNSGFIVGDINRNVRRVGIALDITGQTLLIAKRLGVDLIVSHHPVLFEPQKSFQSGDMAFELASAGIAALCAHTSLDCAAGGVNDILAELLDIEKPEPFPTAEFPAGMVRTGFLHMDSGEELAAHTGKMLCAPVRYCDGGRSIETVAVCGGAGGSCLKEVIDAGIDAFITGDASHHHFLMAAQCGLTLIAAGHFETENPVVPVLAEKLRLTFPDIEFSVIEQELPVETYYPDILR